MRSSSEDLEHFLKKEEEEEKDLEQSLEFLAARVPPSYARSPRDHRLRRCPPDADAEERRVWAAEINLCAHSRALHPTGGNCLSLRAGR